MSIFYFEDENGTFLSTNGERKFIRLRGKEAYEYINQRDNEVIYFEQTVTDENDGELVFIEVSKEKINSDKEKNHEKYLAKCRKKYPYIMLSLYQPLDNVDDLEVVTIEDTISYDDEGLDDIAIREIEREVVQRVLRRSLKFLTDRELKILFSRYYTKEPVTETSLSKEIGVSRTTLQYWEKLLLGKLKKFFTKN